MKEPIILCVDDEEIVLRSLKRELNDTFGATHLIELAASGGEALEVFEELWKDGYDIPVVISDYIMPGLKGDDLLQRIHGISPKTRKIMLTGQANTEGVTNAVNNANLYRYIAKPWEQRDLLLTITEAIRSYDQEQELAKKHQELAQLNQDLQEYSTTLEQKVAERTKELQAWLLEVENTNKKLMESIQYAKLIQRSLLPDPDEIQKCLPDSFFLWMPRDIVGGDIYFIDFGDNGFIVAVLDCTGHGVPGALMTMIASSGLRRSIRDDGYHSPGTILKQLNFSVKTALHQHTNYGFSDDGLDAAICWVNTKERVLTFAGAKLPLYYIHNHKLDVIKGDRQSVGYRRSDLHFTFTEHRINLEKGMGFYLSTDGYIDQLGGLRKRRFGTKRFKALLLQHRNEPFETQRQVLLQAFHEYKGDSKRQDDVTVVGLGFN